MHHVSFWILIGALGISGWQAVAEAQDASHWRRFRGPNGSGVNATSEMPTDLSVARAVWKTSLAGAGHSSPIVANEQVILTGFSKPDQFHVQGISMRDGAEVWHWSTTVPPHPMHQLNSVASSTPATDGERVFVVVPDAQHLQVVALDFQGQECWRRDMGRWTAQHGFGVSPIVEGDRVLFVNSQESFPNLPAPGPSEVIALRTADGADIWRTAIDGGRACYGTPVIRTGENGRKTLILTTAGEGFQALDLETGERQWAQSVFRLRIVGSPVVSGNWLLGNNGSGGGGNYVVALRFQDRQPQVAYELHRAVGYVPTLIEVEGLLFSCTDNGMISCFNLNSGQEQWIERISGGFWSSPVSDGRHLFCLDKTGKMHVLKVSRKYEPPREFDLGEASEATPAIAEGSLLVRTATQIFCFRR